MAEKLRSPIQYYGGKGNMIAKLMCHVPEGGRPYIEPYCGGASLFFARKPAPVEVLNDLNGDVVNLFRVLQEPGQYHELAHRLRFTLYSLSEFRRALEIKKDRNADPVMKAWATFVAQNQGFSGNARTAGNWSRVFMSRQGMAGSTNNWLMRLSMLDDWHRRLLRVQIDCRDALEVIRYWDNADAVFYVDPPYHHDTRANGKTNVYSVEPGHEHHVELVRTLLACRGAVVLSGYDHPVYQPLLESGWVMTKYQTACHAAARNRGTKLFGKGSALRHVARAECVWANTKAVAAMKGKDLMDFQNE